MYSEISSLLCPLLKQGRSGGICVGGFWGGAGGSRQLKGVASRGAARSVNVPYFSPLEHSPSDVFKIFLLTFSFLLLSVSVPIFCGKNFVFATFPIVVVW